MFAACKTCPERAQRAEWIANRHSPTKLDLNCFREPITIGNRKSLRGCSSMVERQLPKLHTGVRFPSPADLPMTTRLETPHQQAKVRIQSQTSSIFVVRFSLPCRLPMENAALAAIRRLTSVLIATSRAGSRPRNAFGGSERSKKTAAEGFRAI